MSRRDSTAWASRLDDGNRGRDTVVDSKKTECEAGTVDLGAQRTAPVRIVRDVFDSATEDVLDPIASSITEAFHLNDFYSAHLLNYCEGSFAHDPDADGSASGSQVPRKVTACSSLNASNVFDPLAVLEEQIKGVGKGLRAFDWPYEVTTGLTALKKAQHATVALYLVAVASMLFSLVVILGSCIVFQSKLLTVVVLTLESISTAALGLATILVTLTTMKSTELVNSLGGDIGLHATIGAKFLGLSWAAWSSILIATTLLLLSIRCGKALRM